MKCHRHRRGDGRHEDGDGINGALYDLLGAELHQLERLAAMAQ